MHCKNHAIFLKKRDSLSHSFAKLVNSFGICNSLKGKYLEGITVKRYQFWLEIKILAST